MKKFAFVLLFLCCAGTAMAQYDSWTGAGAPNRHSSHGQTRPSQYTGKSDYVATPSLALYEPIDAALSSPNQVENIIPSDKGYSVMIGGGLYNPGDTIFGGKIKNVTPDNIVMEFPKVIITNSKVDISYKPGDKIERPSRKPIAQDSHELGEQERQYYETALIEVQENNFEPGVLAKAVSDAMGNQDLVTALYIKYRVGQLNQAHKDDLAKKNEAAKKAALRKAQEDKTITFVTTIDKQAAKVALKYILPILIAGIIAWGIFLFTEWSKKW